MSDSQARRTVASQKDLNVFLVRQNFNGGIALGDEGDDAAAATDVLIEKDASAVLGVRTGTDGAYASIKCLSLETTAGVTPISARTRWATGFRQVAATSGTDTACDNGSIWAAQVYIGANCTLTGIEFLVGSVGGTDKVCVGLYTADGVKVANSILDTSVTVGTAAQLQQVPFTATYAAKGPQTYIAAVQFNGTTAKFRTIPAYTGQESLRVKQAGTFATLAALSPLPTALTGDIGPVLSTY